MVRVLGRISSCPGFHCLLCDCWLGPFWNSLSWFLGHHWLQDLLLLLWPLLLHLFCRAVFFYSSPKCHALSYRPWLRNRHVTPQCTNHSLRWDFSTETIRRTKPKQNKSKLLLNCWMNICELGTLGLPGTIKPKKVQERKKEDRNPILSFKPLDPAVLEAGETTLTFLASSANEFPYLDFCCCFRVFFFFCHIQLPICSWLPNLHQRPRLLSWATDS